MLYFKNSELSKKYQVSLGTVRNWIESSQQGKLDISLHEDKDRYYIYNTPENVRKIEGLVDSRRKFRNSKAFKTIKPQKKFYELFSDEQIYDIIKNIEVNKEIPLQYSYFDGGADIWDKYATRLSYTDSENSFSATQHLLKINESFLETLLSDFDKVNIVDIGPGNGLPVRWLIGFLLERGKLGRYIALDISEAMLEIVESNINRWFDGKVQYEGYVRNINQDRFSDILISDYTDQINTTNIVLHLGYTLRNMQRPENGYRTIYDSIGKDDLFMEDNMLDTDSARKYFDFEYDSSGSSNSFIPNLLSIDPTFYDVEMGFDEKTLERYENIRFKVALAIDFRFGTATKRVEINKGDAILLWRNKHNSLLNILQQRRANGFSVIYSCKTNSEEYMLAIYKPKLSAW